MLNVPDYPIKDPTGAAAFLSQCRGDIEQLASQLGDAWNGIAVTRDASCFQYVRYGVLECAAAAYALRDRVVFRAAVRAMLTYAAPDAIDRFQPTPAQLGTDLAVALGGRHVDKAHALARRILQAGSEVDGDVPESLQARTLAHLLDLDTDGARHALRRMPAAIDAARLLKHEHAVLSAWCMAAECIVQRVDLDLGSHLTRVTTVRAAYLDKMLGRWAKGQVTDLSPVDFWDYQTAALIVAARSIGLARGLAPEALPFSDWQWTGEACTWD